MYFDIGANIGNWTLSNLNSCDKIISVEASPSTFQNLLSNVNNNPKIICLNYAVCNSNDEYITFYNCNADTLSTINKDWLDSDISRFYNKFKYDVIKCKPITIDKLIELYGIPELIKIDVEGGEFECISSLTQKVNNLCFEWASETNDITFKCLDYLKECLSKTSPKNEWGMIWVK